LVWRDGKDQSKTIRDRDPWNYRNLTFAKEGIKFQWITEGGHSFIIYLHLIPRTAWFRDGLLFLRFSG